MGGDQLMRTRPLSEAPRIPATPSRETPLGMIAMLRHELIHERQPRSQRANTAVVLPVFFQSQAGPRTGRITNRTSIQRCRSPPPSGPQERGQNRLLPLIGFLPGALDLVPRRVAITGDAVSDATFRLRFE